MAKKQSKTTKKDNNVFAKSVKPYYYNTDQCFIYYSSSKVLSSQSQFSVLTPEKIKSKFGFEFLCNDLLKSVRDAESFRSEKDIKTLFPKELINKVDSYGIETNTMNLFVLHKLSSKIGFGISTYAALKKGMVIAEYVGERKDAHIKIEDTSYLLINDDGTNIDGKDYGNAARFFHHCPSEHADEQVMTANLAIVPWKTSETVTKVFFITTRDIKAFEPLCWDYGDKFNFEHDVELLNSQSYEPLIDFNKDEL
jgi:hypothetical protein